MKINKDLIETVSLPDRKTAKLSLKWLSVAKSDLKSAAILYHKKLWSQAIYSLQQSVEKSCKSIALYCKLVKKNEMWRSIGHDSYKFYALLIRRLKADVVLHKNWLTKENYEKYYKMYEDQEKLFLAIGKNPKKLEIAKLNETWIVATLKMYENNGKTYFDAMCLPLLSDISNLKGIRDLPNYSASFMFMYFSKLLSLAQILTGLAIITYPHEAYSRYPGKEMNPKSYNESTGIVKTFPIIFSLNDQICYLLGDFFTDRMPKKFSEINEFNRFSLLKFIKEHVRSNELIKFYRKWDKKFYTEGQNYMKRD
jgi:HEPN domain-containing protein